MINHALTLLLNGTVKEGREYLPDYKPKKLPKFLQQIWDILFGDVSDSAKWYRAQQLLTVIHASPLVSYIYDLDPRVTYWPFTKWTVDEADELIPIVALLPELTKALEYKSDQLFVPGMHPAIDIFHDHWHNNILFTYKLNSVVLALIYRIEALDEVEEC